MLFLLSGAFACSLDVFSVKFPPEKFPPEFTFQNTDISKSPRVLAGWSQKAKTKRLYKSSANSTMTQQISKIISHTKNYASSKASWR